MHLSGSKAVKILCNPASLKYLRYATLGGLALKNQALTGCRTRLDLKNYFPINEQKKKQKQTNKKKKNKWTKKQYRE